MNKRRVVATGLGVVSPFGVGLETYWRGLVSGASAIRPIERFDGSAYRSQNAAEVPLSFTRDTAARAGVGSPAEDATFYLAVAANEALIGAGVGPVFSDEDRVGCVLGSLCAGAQHLNEIGAAFQDGRELPAAAVADSSMVFYQLEFLADRHNLTGPSSLVSTACASTTDAVGFATDLIQQGECDRAIAGGGDILVEGIHGGFNSLFSISVNRPVPFDKERDGFCIGEGAGVIYLETLESALSRGATIYAEVLGHGLSNTAFHLTATSEDGSGEALAIRRALEVAGLPPEAVGYVNTHGTATLPNDASEIRAIRLVFGAHAAAIVANSIKPAIGHCMGAAGIMEAIATIMTVYTGTVPPTPFSHGNEDGLPMDLVIGEARTAHVQYAISESFGFGGACSCLVVAKYPNALTGLSHA